MARHPPRDDQHLEVETPENVVLDYEVAGVGSRLHASVVDLLWLILSLVGLLVLGALLSSAGVATGWAELVLVFGAILGFWAWFTFFEALREGQTPGKRSAGIRVVLDTGHPLTFSAAAARNLLRAIDLFPPLLLVDALLVALHPRGRRLGDLVAGTIVVRDRPIESEIASGEPAAAEAEEELGVPQLEEPEFRMLREFMERAPTLTPELRDRFATRLAERIAGRIPPRAVSAFAQVSQAYQLELARRRSRFATTRTGKGGVAERFVARKSSRWAEFQQLADRVSRRGLNTLKAAELPDFAARYREVAADLARARTYGTAPGVRRQLERLVAAGHNALYRDQRKTLPRLWAILMRECPAAVLRQWRYVVIAMLCFAAPLATGFLVLREQPALAQEVLPEGMLRRAEAGAERAAAGLGYYEAAEGEQPMAATFIISNNVRVAVLCFAGGALFGVGALVLLAFNGLAIGTTFGHFANLGLFGYIGSFVVGHGALELLAICVAGAAGLVLGKAMIAPGELPRGEALVIQGRTAVRMIGAVTFMLVLAGLIEGFISTGTGSLRLRVSVSAASLVVLLLYLYNGARNLRR